MAARTAQLAFFVDQFVAAAQAEPPVFTDRIFGGQWTVCAVFAVILARHHVVKRGLHFHGGGRLFPAKHFFGLDGFKNGRGNELAEAFVAGVNFCQ